MAVLLLLWGCSDKNNYVVKSGLTGLTDGYAYLQVFGEEGLEIVDSALIEQGSFMFRGEKPEPEFVYITFSNSKGRIGFFSRKYQNLADRSCRFAVESENQRLSAE